VAARLAADVMGTPTILLARTDAEAARPGDQRRRQTTTSLSSPASARSKASTSASNGIEQAISRGLAYAPYADLIWCETWQAGPGLRQEVRRRHPRQVPGQAAGLQLQPSFNWKKNLDDATIAKFQRELGAMGYKFQFITLAGFHSLNYGMFDLAYGYARNNMTAFVELQQKEFAAADKGFTAVKHQREVGTGYFDAVTTTIEAPTLRPRR
jgi:isocitrate lyase